MIKKVDLWKEDKMRRFKNSFDIYKLTFCQVLHVEINIKVYRKLGIKCKYQKNAQFEVSSKSEM